MISQKISVALALALVWVVPLPAWADVKIGPWTILSGASSGDRYCTMENGIAVNGIGLQVIPATEEVYVAVSNPNWDLTPAQVYQVKYLADNQLVWEKRSQAINQTTLRTRLSLDIDPVGALSKAKSMVVTFESKSATFDLTGAAEAREALNKCLGTITAQAPGPIPPEKVGDWVIEPVKNAPGECFAERTYVDKDDDNADNMVVLRLGKAEIGIVLGYSKWNWDVGEKTSAALVTPDGILNANAEWVADKTGKVIRSEMSLKALPVLQRAKSIIVKFSDADAEFDVPMIRQAIETMARCGERTRK